MKKFAFVIALTLYSLAQPPAALPLPKECKTIPPMLIFFPKPMEKELIPCRNVVFLPSLKMVKKRFPNAKSITIAKGFERLYEIRLENNETLFCNKDLMQCIQGILVRQR